MKHRNLIVAALMLTPAVPLFAQDFDLIADHKTLIGAGDAQTAQNPSQLAQQLIDRGLTFVKSKQLPDGGWNKDPEPPALTPLALRGFARTANRDDAVLNKGVARLLSYQKPDGGIYGDINAN